MINIFCIALASVAISICILFLVAVGIIAIFVTGKQIADSAKCLKQYAMAEKIKRSMYSETLREDLLDKAESAGITRKQFVAFLNGTKNND